jgi:cyclic pyranopterin phosphate synthase
MVDISKKKVVPRLATAEGRIDLSSDSLEAIRKGKVRKGDALEVARIAAITAVKATPQIIPHCHHIPIESVQVDLRQDRTGVRAVCTVKARYRTGVEMEALTGVSVALLTLWDMVKYLEKDTRGQYPGTRIHGIRVIEKRKGGPRKRAKGGRKG